MHVCPSSDSAKPASSSEAAAAVCFLSPRFLLPRSASDSGIPLLRYQAEGVTSFLFFLSMVSQFSDSISSISSRAATSVLGPAVQHSACWGVVSSSSSPKRLRFSDIVLLWPTSDTEDAFIF